MPIFYKQLASIVLLILLILLGISSVGYAVAQTGYVLLACFVSSSLSLLAVWAFALLTQKI